MKKAHLIIFNTYDEILLLYNNGTFSLPNIEIYSNCNKNDIICYLKDNFRIRVKENSLIKKLTDKDNIYYYCEEPMIKKFVRDNIETIWIDKHILKDVLLNTNKEDCIKLVAVLSKILGTNFSFSAKEKSDLLWCAVQAKHKGDFDTVKYINSRMIYSIVGNNNKLKEIDDEYKLLLMEKLKNDIDIIISNKVKKISINDMTEDEAKLAGIFNEWEKKFIKVYNIVSKHLPAVPTRKIDYYDESCKLHNKDGLTINILLDLYNRYKDLSYEEIRGDLLQRRKK